MLCPNDKNLDMAMIFEVITMLSALVLGFILGRIWEIRREMRRDHQNLPKAEPMVAQRTKFRPATGYPPPIFNAMK